MAPLHKGPVLSSVLYFYLLIFEQGTCIFILHRILQIRDLSLLLSKFHSVLHEKS